jgi:hypothetical protein
MSGVDLLLRRGESPVAAGVGIKSVPPLRHHDRWSAALVGGVGHDLNSGSGESVDQAVLPGGAHVMAGARKRRRGPHQPSGRISQDLHVHAVPLVLTGVERAVSTRGHGDPVDRQQGAIKDHERLPASDLECLVQGRRRGSQDIEPFRDIAMDRGGADPEAAGQSSVSLAFAQVGHTSSACRPAGSRRHRLPMTVRRWRNASASVVRARLDTCIEDG